MAIKRRNVTLANLSMSYLNLAVSFVSGFVLLPVSLSYIPTEEYGAWLVMGEFFAWLVILDPGVGVALKQRVASSYGLQDFHAIDNYFASLVLILAFLVIVFAMGAGVMYWNLDFIIDRDASLLHGLEQAVAWGVTGTVLAMLSYPVNAMNIGLMATFQTGVFDIGANVLRIATSLFLLMQGYGVIGLGLGVFVSGLFLLLSNGTFLLYRKVQLRLNFKYDRGKVMELIKLMGFTSLGGLSQAILRSSNMFFVNRFIGSHAAVLVKVNQTGPDIMRQLLERPIMAMSASISHLKGEGNPSKLGQILIEYFNYLIVAIGLFIVGVTCLSKYFISLWVGEKFFGGFTMVILIGIALSMKIVASTFSNVLFGLGSIRRNNLTLVTKAAVYCVLVVILMKRIGVNGLFVAMIISECLVSFLVYPVLLFKSLELPKELISRLAMNFISVIGVSSVTIVGFFLVRTSIDTWYSLLTAGIVVSSIYFMMIFGVSPFARRKAFYFLKFLR